MSNETEYDLVELNVSDTGAVSWGANELAATLGPGQNVCLKDISAGDYDIRALFDVKEAGKALVPCYNWGVEFTTLNLALTYLWDGEECYSTLDWYL
ncbi:MAG: hypothetical protein JXR94_13405 [Candidatus Hydrogenedentes bacterium]|nr:hypothetical protein [Candidatus Hydrogenedentota bacterium]